MKPYYSQTGVTIYNADCREVLPSLDVVDLVLTDPPYGISWKSQSRQLSMHEIEGDHDTSIGNEVLKLCADILRRNRHLYAFGRWDLKGMGYGGACELIWDKVAPSNQLSEQWVSQHEYVSFATNRKSEVAVEAGRGNGAARLRRGSVLTYQRLCADAVVNHPTEKPVLLLREFIESSSHIGEVVLDPFCGSCSTLEAAKLEGRKAIGIEISEEYCEIGARRLSQEVFTF
jgi:DNA modification methylase